MQIEGSVILVRPTVVEICNLRRFLYIKKCKNQNMAMVGTENGIWQKLPLKYVIIHQVEQENDGEFIFDIYHRGLTILSILIYLVYLYT